MRLRSRPAWGSPICAGEQQRVAIARAPFNAPALILADEPTASLDPAQAAEVGALQVTQESGATLLCAPHDTALLARMSYRQPITIELRG